MWPAELIAELGGVREGRGLHDFEVLLVLRGGACGEFVEPFADVDLVDSMETVEGGEELVVTTGAGGGDEAAHGEGVDEGVVELLVLEGRRGGDVAFCADGLWGNAAGGADVFCEAEGGGVDAEMVGGGVGEEGFSVDGAAEVHVEVSSFGHAAKKCVEGERAGGIRLCGVEGADGAALRRCGRWLGGGLLCGY